MKPMPLILALIFSLISLCSCKELENEKGSFQEANFPECLNDGSCLMDKCETELCKKVSETLVHVEIEPAARSGYIGQQHLNVPLGLLFGKGLELKPMVYFYGTMIRAKMTPASGSSRTVRDNPDMSSDIIAIPLSLDEESGKKPLLLANQSVLSTSVDSRGFFTLSLVAGQRYRLVANPLGLNDLPPTFLDVQIESDHVGDISLPTEGRKVSGVIRQTTAFSNEELSQKLWIRVVQGKRQVSSLGRLSTDGRFSVTLANTLFEKDLVAHPVQLLIEPTSDVSYFATVRINLNMEDEDDINVGVLNLGPERPLIRSHFLIQSETNEPVKDARVIVRSLTSTGYIQSSATSDNNGLAEIVIPEGKYDLAVIPQQDAVSGFKKVKDVDLHNSDPVHIKLETRAKFQSNIVDESGTPVKGARLVLTRFARTDSDTRESIFENTELRLEAKSDAKGDWCSLGVSATEECKPIVLDSGRYRMSVTPPEGSRFPYFTQVFDFPENAAFPIVLKKAISLKGRILAPKAEVPVANSFIRIYSSQTEKESAEPIFLTQAFSRIDGSFSVALPQEYVLGKAP